MTRMPEQRLSRMSPHQIERFLLQQGMLSAIRFDEQIVPQAGLDAIDPALKERFLRGELPEKMQLKKLYLIAEDETLVNLLSRYFPADLVSKRQNIIERRGEGVPTILNASERLSTRHPLYENHENVELKLTVYAASRELNGLVAQFD